MQTHEKASLCNAWQEIFCYRKAFSEKVTLANFVLVVSSHISTKMVLTGSQLCLYSDFWYHGSIARCIFTEQEKGMYLYWVLQPHTGTLVIPCTYSLEQKYSPDTIHICKMCWAASVLFALRFVSLESPMLHHLLLCIMDTNVLAERQECSGWTLDCLLPGEPSFLAHVMDFSTQLLHGEQLPFPVFSSLFFYIWPRSLRSTSFLVIETRGAFADSCSPADARRIMNLPHAEILLCS